MRLNMGLAGSWDSLIQAAETLRIQDAVLISSCGFSAFITRASCISSRAIRNESVDSAPWFSLMRSG